MCSAAYQLSLFEDDLDVKSLLNEYARRKWEQGRPRQVLRPTLKANFVMLEDGEQVLRGMHWGLIPSWASTPKMPGATFNARAETLSEKPAFRDSFRSMRGVMVLDTYVEWREEEGKDIPYELGVEEEGPVLIAGLWAHWGNGNASLESCTMITCEPNEVARLYQTRMPAILDLSHIDRWLDPNAKPEHLKGLLKPFDAKRMFAKAADPSDFKKKRRGEPEQLPLNLSLFD